MNGHVCFAPGFGRVKQLLCALLALACWISLSHAQGAGRPLYHREYLGRQIYDACMPAPPAVSVTEYSNIVYATVPRGDGMGTFGLMLDAHVPSPGTKFPALIYVHGGGWISGSRTGPTGEGSTEEAFAQYYAAQGPFVVFNIDYRMPCDAGDPSLEYFDGTPHLSPRAAICGYEAHRHPIPLADVRAAIDWVSRNGAQYNADVTRIGVVGDSAGGHLALLAATYDGTANVRRLKPRAVVAFSPPLDFDLAGHAALTNDGTPSPPVPVLSSPHGAGFDECAFVAHVPSLGGFGWTNDAGGGCAARWYRKLLVGPDYMLGDLPEEIASRAAWMQASPRHWVGSTNPLAPDPPVYFFMSEGESRVLEQEGEGFIDAASEVPTMSGSAFCRLSAENGLDEHASGLLGRPIEPGCFGYDGGAPPMTVLDSTLQFLRAHMPPCDTTGPVASVADAATLEGDTGTVRLGFPVRLEAPAATAITIAYATAGGTAQEGIDFLGAGGEITFGAGETEAIVSVDVLGDTDQEENETLAVWLTGITWGIIDDCVGAGTIVDDDPAAVIPADAAPYQVARSNDPAAPGRALTGAATSSCRPGNPATGVTKYPDIVYATVPRGDGQGTFGLMLDAHVPFPGERFPALLYVHGGGWVGGSRTDWSGEDTEVFVEHYAQHGPFVVFNMDYRMPCSPTDPTLAHFDNTPHLSPRAAICNQTAHRHPIPLADVRAAVQWVRENGALFNADVSKIGIVGNSAGGHLALLAATYDGAAPMAPWKPQAAVGFSPPVDFGVAAQAGLSNIGTPAAAVPLSASAHGGEFDECAFVQYVPALGGLGWMNAGGGVCAARAYRRKLVGHDYLPGTSDWEVASRVAWNQASPAYWAGTTSVLSPDPPVYFFIGESESRVLEQEGQSFIDAAKRVPSMSGSAFCRLSAQSARDDHAGNLAGRPIEPGCFGYEPGAASQMNVLQSTMKFLRANLPWCGNDCDASHPDTYPEAPEVNDAMDNQCPGDPGYGLTDEITGVAGFFDAADPARYAWPAQQGATLYEVARSSRPTFAPDCALLPPAADPFVNDIVTPAPGGILFLLVRPVAPGAGSWGRTSDGAERHFVCPNP